MTVHFHTGFAHQFPSEMNYGLDDYSPIATGSLALLSGSWRLAVSSRNDGNRDYGAMANFSVPGETLWLGGLLRALSITTSNAVASATRWLAIFVDGSPVLNLALNLSSNTLSGGILSGRGLGVYGAGEYDSSNLPASSEALASFDGVYVGSSGTDIWWQLGIVRGATGGSVKLRLEEEGQPQTRKEYQLVDDYAPLASSGGSFTGVQYRAMRNGSFTSDFEYLSHGQLWVDDERNLGKARSEPLLLSGQGAHSDFVASEAGDNYTMVNDVPPDTLKALTFSIGDKDSWTLTGAASPAGRYQVASVTSRFWANLDAGQGLQAFVREGTVDLPAGPEMEGSGSSYEVVSSLMVANPHTSQPWSLGEIGAGFELGVEATDTSV